MTMLIKHYFLLEFYKKKLSNYFKNFRSLTFDKLLIEKISNKKHIKD